VSDADVFGPSIGRLDVEEAVIAHLENWMPTYLGREARKRDVAAMRPIKTYAQRTSYAKWPSQLLPLVLVNCPGIVKGSVVKDGEGNVSKAYRLILGVLVSADTEPHTQELLANYAAAVRDAILPHESLDGFAEFCDLVDEDSTAFPAEPGEERTRGSVGFEFAVGVRNVVNAFKGPAEPLDPPDEAPPDLPTVLTHTTTVTAE
jgi:hypothetical protein